MKGVLGRRSVRERGLEKMSGELPAPGFTVGAVAKEKGADGEEEEESPISFSPSPPVSEQIHQDILAAEFLVGLFWSATNSFRHDSILRPFPPMYVEGGGGVEGEGSEGAEESHREGAEGAEPQGGREGDKNKDIEGLVRICHYCAHFKVQCNFYCCQILILSTTIKSNIQRR